MGDVLHSSPGGDGARASRDVDRMLTACCTVGKHAELNEPPAHVTSDGPACYPHTAGSKGASGQCQRKPLATKLSMHVVTAPPPPCHHCHLGCRRCFLRWGNKEFERYVEALAAQADEALEQSPDQQPRAGEVVVQVMDLEADFWNMAYAP